MKAPPKTAPAADRDQGASATDQTLFDLVEQITDQLQRGEPVDLDRYAADFPQYAEPLAKLLPALQAVEQISQTDPSSNSALRTPGYPLGAVLETLGDFRILRELGRGGMGIVYEAEQLSIGRRVALKVLPFAAMVDHRALQRFRNEIRAVGTLDHPNIVAVHFVGEERGVNYYAMQLVRGQSLAEVIAALRQSRDESQETRAGIVEPPLTAGTDAKLPSGQQPIANSQQPRTNALETQPLAALSTEYSTNPKRFFRRVAELGIQAAEALQHAHDQGIVHRDIKPANLLLDTGGKLYVTDFGLARLENDASMTASGDLLGTLRYMSPEQASGDRQFVDQRADVYSLGATLYELAVLRPVFDGRNREELLRQITSSDPPPLRSASAAVPAELETILLKALAKDPADRFTSAQDLAEDLRRFMSYEPIRARRPSPIARCSKWARRHQAAAWSTVAVLLLAVIGLGVGSGLVLTEQRQTADALAEKETALEQSARNFALALRAVDDMYGQIATSWISSDRDLTDTQLSFLRRARSIFSQIARECDNGADLRATAADAYRKAADIHARLLEFDHAKAAYSRAAALLDEELAENPAVDQVRRNLALTYKRLGDLNLGFDEISEADFAYRSAAAQYDDLIKRNPRHVDYRLSMLSLQYSRAHMAGMRLSDREAIEIAQDLQQNASDALQTHPNLVRARTLRLMAALIICRSQRRLGNDEDAAQVCRDALAESRHGLHDSQDDPYVARAIAEVTAELARCQLATGDITSAEENLRDALARIQDSFLFNGTPKEFSMAYLGRKVTNDLMEPDAFAQYAQVQASLGDVLRQADQRDEAFTQLDESLSTFLLLAELFPGKAEFVGGASDPARGLARLDLSAEPRLQANQLHKIGEACELMKRQRERPSASAQLIASGADLVVEYARALARTGQKDAALACCREEISYLQRAANARPEDGRINARLTRIERLVEEIDQLK